MRHTKESLKQLLKQFKTYSAIADHLGCRKQNISQLCKRHGLKSVSGAVRRKLKGNQL